MITFVVNEYFAIKEELQISVYTKTIILITEAFFADHPDYAVVEMADVFWVDSF